MGDRHQLDTRLIHAGEPDPRPMRSVTLPIFQSATYEYGGEGDYDALKYSRLNNTPNHDALHGKLAALEGAQAALVTASGMAAVTTTLLSLLNPGDHMIAQRILYGGTHDFVTQTLARMGVTTTFVDGDDPDAWASACTPKTRVFYVEAMTNPLLEVADLPAAAAFARSRGLLSIIDATFTPPVIFRPLEHGFDLVVHSATKYLNGHSDITAGAIAGDAKLVDGIRRLLAHLGGTLDPHACFLLHRGLKTLGVRMRHQCATAQRVAEFLAEHPAVARVSYPGLPQHPHHDRAAALFEGFGGMMSVELRGGSSAALHTVGATKLFVNAPSLGGVESLITMPAQTSHAGLDSDLRRGLGISDGLIRLSIGLESPADLIDDLGEALE